MISKIVEALKEELLTFFNKHNIVLTAKYSPSLSKIERYFKDYMITQMGNPFASEDIGQYQNVMLYNIGTPDIVSEKFNNLRLHAYSRLSSFNDTGPVSSEENLDYPNIFKFTKDRIIDESNEEDGNVVRRAISYLVMPVKFRIFTESIDNMYDILLLLKQQIRYHTTLVINLNLTRYDDDCTQLEYFLDWGVDNIQIEYADFESNALNTIEFECKVEGGYISNFGVRDSVLNSIEITVGYLNAEN